MKLSNNSLITSLFLLTGIGIFSACKITKNYSARTTDNIQKVTMEKTLAIIKPDAVRTHHIGDIVARIEKEQFAIRGMKMLQLTKKQAEDFYAVHKGRPFFDELVTFMISGPVVVIALEKENAVKTWRDVMGSTNPGEAAPNTLRKLFGTSIGNNATHGSDSIENGKIEVTFFFPELK